MLTFCPPLPLAFPSWINGHTDRFNCLVNHDGIFDSKNGFYHTEELYFPEHEVCTSFFFFDLQHDLELRLIRR